MDVFKKLAKNQGFSSLPKKKAYVLLLICTINSALLVIILKSKLKIKSTHYSLTRQPPAELHILPHVGASMHKPTPND